MTPSFIITFYGFVLQWGAPFLLIFQAWQIVQIIMDISRKLVAKIHQVEESNFIKVRNTYLYDGLYNYFKFEGTYSWNFSSGLYNCNDNNSLFVYSNEFECILE